MVNFRGNWYGVKEIVPNGAVLSVDVANIAVYYVFKCLVYDQEQSPLAFMRFVDDGGGFLMVRCLSLMIGLRA